ncbi:MAG: hypothetical protein H6739_20795 [Alphaproteobacteria bacterium]|nr:hypothetical protein [Alphaproteobacteria bacterium]
MTCVPRALTHLIAAFVLAFTLMLPAAQARTPGQAQDLPALVDDSFQVPSDVALVSFQPVADEPAVPPGVSEPDNDLTILWVILAAAGGFVAGMFVGCFMCFALYWY